jgi:hypothetical protein
MGITMSSAIRVIDAQNDRMRCAICGGADDVSELHLTARNHTTVTPLCRACVAKLAHAATRRLVELESEDTQIQQRGASALRQDAKL